ncbi:DUF2000 domain-containing protein [Mucilaginibacter gossypii]|uniref:DUF2000 domain-containing protein n=1 Tax=Mucilaginibacter gossypii TaxID=551996 RepID=A0A1G8AI39_9SPHI|nr:DUF2000 domain-containing protein [Mucilaginibacter gossypii]SDH20632.1 hypothetical protein SAMN05192573_107206 [Mucilaginibacter gossypii]
MYENKIAVVILKDLDDWQKLNVTAFLASSVAIAFPETHGAALVSATGTAYLPFLKHPILVYAAQSGEQIRRAFNRASERQLHLGIYTSGLFATKNEQGNLTEIAGHADADLDLVGIVIYGENKKVDKAVDKLKFHS